MLLLSTDVAKDDLLHSAVILTMNYPPNYLMLQPSYCAAFSCVTALHSFNEAPPLIVLLFIPSTFWMPFAVEIIWRPAVAMTIHMQIYTSRWFIRYSFHAPLQDDSGCRREQWCTSYLDRPGNVCHLRPNKVKNISLVLLPGHFFQAVKHYFINRTNILMDTM